MASSTTTLAVPENVHQFEHRIDIPKGEYPLLWSGSFIYKVPVNLRSVNQQAYNPQLISIGPLHHGRKQLKPMERQKKIYFNEFHKRLMKQNNVSSEMVNTSLNKFKEFIKEKEEKIRHCYSAGTSHFGSEEFVEMIMLDAIFIMEIVLRITDKIKCEMDCMLSKPWLRKGIEMDLLLLENQIPFFILEELYQLIPRTKNSNFLDLALQYFSNYDPQKKSSDKTVEIKQIKDVLHFTDLVRCFYLPNMDLNFDRDTCDVLYSATKLNEAGVVFKHVNDKRLLDITFKKKWVLKWLPFLSCLPFINCLKAHLELSPFKVDSGTECVLRNLIALEQCHYPSSAYICNYFLLMDQLINTVTDTELLVQNKVLKNLLGSNKQGTILVNRLCEQVVVSNYCYVQIINRLNEHYDQFWNRNMAALNSVYFRDVWRSTSTVVGLIVVFATMYNFFRNFYKDYQNNFKFS